MNRTPRTLNRVLCFLAGILVMVVGTHLVLLTVVREYAIWWQDFSSRIGQWSMAALESATLSGQKSSWLWILIALVLIVVILLMVWWIAVQGKGRVSEYVNVYDEDDPLPGRIEITDLAVEQALRVVLGKRHDIVSMTATLWEGEQTPGLRIKVHPRKGVAPAALGVQLASVAREAQELLGASGPVVVHLAAGPRSRFARNERVQ